MAGFRKIRLVDKRPVYAEEKGEIIEVGSYAELGVTIWVMDNGSAGTCYIQHAGSRDAGAFETLGSAVNCNATGIDRQSHTSFLPFVRFASDSDVAGPPLICVDMICKE